MLSRQDDRSADEGVRIIGTPAPLPTEARPSSAPRRPRRVKAPAKKLGTPDAERVLVRPGQPPVRVQGSAPRGSPTPRPKAPAADPAPAAPDDRADAPPGGEPDADEDR